jgi:16S rRNA processing protein RimM
MSPEGADEVALSYVAVGRVVGVWGVRGDLKVEPLAPGGQLVAGRSVTVSGLERTIERSKNAGRFMNLKLSGIEGREEARMLRGAYLQVPEGELEPPGEGEYYRFQLLGLSVRSGDGRELGHVTDILSTAGNDVYVVQGPLGEILVPAIDDIVRNVDIEEGEITVDVVPGLLPDSP